MPAAHPELCAAKELKVCFNGVSQKQVLGFLQEVLDTQLVVAHPREGLQNENVKFSGPRHEIFAHFGLREEPRTSATG